MKKDFATFKAHSVSIAFLFFMLISLSATSCASTAAGKSSESEDLFEEPRLFADWQYKGFGQEYPQWAEESLKQGESETVEIHFGQNPDMLIPHEDEESESGMVKQIWVYIDPYYEEYEERYAYITLRQGQEE